MYGCESPSTKSQSENIQIAAALAGEVDARHRVKSSLIMRASITNIAQFQTQKNYVSSQASQAMNLPFLLCYSPSDNILVLVPDGSSRLAH